MILVGVGVLGAARAPSSGPVESWFVDSMRGADHALIESGLARGQIAESLGLGVGSVIGGLLPRLGSALPQTGGGFSRCPSLRDCRGDDHRVRHRRLAAGDR